MYRTKYLFVTIVSLFAINACTSMDNQSQHVNNNDEYIYVVDQDKINAVERARRASALSLQTVWVNLPVKRMKKSEYLASQEKQ